MKTKIYTIKNFDKQELKESVYNDFDKIDFMMIAFNPKLDIDIDSFISKQFGDIKYVAFYSIDSFKNREIISDSLVVAIFEFEKSAEVELFFIEDIRNFKCDDSLLKCANYLNENSDKFHIILSSYSNELFGLYVEMLSDLLTYQPIDNIIGGISSNTVIDDELKSYQFINNRVIKNGFVIISFKNVEYELGISLGFQPYGITYQITKAHNYKIYEVDNGKKFSSIAKGLVKNLEEEEEEPLWYLPLNMIDDNKDRIDTLRTIEYVNEEFVKLFGPIKEGQRFKLSFADEYELIKEDEEVIKAFAKRLNDPQILFNFSCIARQYVLANRQADELNTYLDKIDTNLFGFFTFGEIGPNSAKDKLKLYNQTSLIAGIKEL